MRPPRVVGEKAIGSDKADRRPARTAAEIAERDDKRRRFAPKTTRFTPEYEAWLDRQVKKGRNQT